MFVIFKLTQRYLAYLGIKFHQPTVSHGFNEQNLIISGVFGVSSVLTTLYLIEDPNFSEKYVITVYAATASVLCTVDYVTLIWKTSKIFEYIKSIDVLIQMSEWIKLLRLNVQRSYCKICK